jgi:uncharacterized protein DUF5372
MRFTALLHHVTLDRLRTAYFSSKKDAAAGVDGITWQHYGQQLDENLQRLHSEVPRETRRSSGRETLILHDRTRGTLSVLREWTDWAEPSPLSLAGLPPRRFALERLLELVKLVESLRREADR